MTAQFAHRKFLHKLPPPQIRCKGARSRDYPGNQLPSVPPSHFAHGIHAIWRATNAGNAATAQFFSRSFYIRFPKITLPLHLALFFLTVPDYNIHSYQAVSLSTQKLNLASHL
ncbi:MAG: hypothetical protein ACRD3B_12635 [Candidatus Sulfotelmatobacter sp.]